MFDALEKITDSVGGALFGSHRKLWPDLNYTKCQTETVKPARRRKRGQGRLVKPLKNYSFHTNFDVRTDGRQWVIRCVTGYISYRAYGGVGFFLGMVFLIIGINLGLENEDWAFSILSLPFFVYTLYSVAKVRTGGEDTWIILDRTSGNVCFWKRNAKNALTVPFDQVDCFWSTKGGRGGPSHHLAFMPKVNLPNERHRYWEIMLGSAPMYEQAQYFWRVINDFMDPTRPIPEVPGLIHQVRSMEKLGWTLEDITHGGKDMPIEEWQEVEKELRRDAEALDERLRRLFTPEYFEAQTIYDFYQQAPVHFKKDALRTILIKFKQFNRAGMYPGFFDHYTQEKYDVEVTKLGKLLSNLPSRESFYTDYS